MYGTPFEIFGVVHLLTIAIVLLVSALLPKFIKINLIVKNQQ